MNSEQSAIVLSNINSKGIQETIINIKNTYFGAFDVIKNILFGSKNLNIQTIYIAILRFLIFLW